MKEELVFLNKEFNKKKELFKFISDELYELGYVKEDFNLGLENREREYPTGLQTKNIGIAIPHTDSYYVNKSCVSFISLAKPIDFVNMDGSIEPVKVELVFVLAIKTNRGQLDKLQKLSEIFLDDDILDRLRHATEVKQVMDIFNDRNI